MELTASDLLAQLQALAEPDYKAFSEKLLPGVNDLLGVRIPALRRLAQQIARQPEEFLALARTGALSGLFEGRMLWGMVLFYAKLPEEARIPLLEEFLPQIDCWSICDSVCATGKSIARAPALYQPWLTELTQRPQEYAVRFGLVCWMDHFANTCPAQLLAVCSRVQHPGYYARMANAWALSVCAVKAFDETLALLQQSPLDAFTHNKAIQKACESYRLQPEQKAALRALKRPAAQARAAQPSLPTQQHSEVLL